MTPVPNPTDTAQALVERFENALDDFHNLDAELSVSAHDKVIAEVNAAKAALLAHMAGVEHERDEAQAKVRGYEMMRKAKLSLSNTYGKDDPYATRPTEARDS